MKKLKFTAVTLVLMIIISCVAFSSCVKKPIGTSSGPYVSFPEDSTVSQKEESHIPSDASADTESPSASKPSENSEISNPEESLPEESVGEESRDEEKETIGPLFSKIVKILRSDNKLITTVESKTVGGDSFPYTVKAYIKGDRIYTEIEESFGALSQNLIIGDAFHIIDNHAKAVTIINTQDAGVELFKPYSGKLKFKGGAKETLYGVEYDRESYIDSDGKEFDVFFLNGVLERYRSYDEKVKDTVVIRLSVSSDISGGMFEIPKDYKVTDAR